MPKGHHQHLKQQIADISMSPQENFLYPLILDAIGDAICMFDGRGELTWQNKACITLCSELTADRRPSASITDQIRDTQLDDFRKHLFRALNGEHVFFEWVCKNRNKAFLMELRPLRDESQVMGVMGIIWENVHPGSNQKKGKRKSVHRMTGREKVMYIAGGSDISKLKHTQQKLVESEEAFNRLFHESNEPILLLDGKNFIDCNNATLSLLGYTSRDEFLHQPPWKISPKKQPDGLLSTVKAKRLIREALEKGYNRFEWIHLKADGSDFPVEVMLTPIFVKGRQLFYTVWRDITDRQTAEAALQESNKEISAYKYALDQATIVSFSDAAGNITYVNDNFERLYGYTKDEIIGVNHNVLNSGLHPAEFWKKFWATINSGNVLKADVCNKAKDGTLHWADTTIVPFLDKKGKPAQYLAIRSDITEKRKLENELKGRERIEQIRITETALDAQEKERNFLGQELHDNVNQILVATKLVLSVAAGDPEKYRDIINNSIQNIQRAIEENRKLSHSLATPDLKLMSLPRQLTSLVHSMFYQQPVKVTFSRKGFKDELVDDKRKIAIYRIAQEQCTNIIKYAGATRVGISLRIKKSCLQLVIKDNGTGMETGISTDGIGIRNMRARVSIYGGTLTIVTAPGKGFTLSVTIPL